LYPTFRVDAQLSVVGVFVEFCCWQGDTSFNFVRRKDCIWRLHGVFLRRLRSYLDWQGL
jgi:hypothetical protein